MGNVRLRPRRSVATIAPPSRQMLAWLRSRRLPLDGRTTNAFSSSAVTGLVSLGFASHRSGLRGLGALGVEAEPGLVHTPGRGFEIFPFWHGELRERDEPE